MTILSELVERKAALRSEMLVRRTEAAARQGEAAATAVAANVLQALRTRRKAVISGYWPLAGELDIRPAMAALAGAGHLLALPRVQGRARPLQFHLWTHDDPLIEGPFRLREPPDNLPRAQPDVLLVPLLAFDRRGHRLGHGAGFYDRTLEKLRAEKPAVLALGVAFAAQEVDEVPVGLVDQPLDGVITEQAVHPCSARFASDASGGQA